MFVGFVIYIHIYIYIYVYIYIYLGKLNGSTDLWAHPSLETKPQGCRVGPRPSPGSVSSRSSWAHLQASPFTQMPWRIDMIKKKRRAGGIELEPSQKARDFGFY